VRRENDREEREREERERERERERIYPLVADQGRLFARVVEKSLFQRGLSS
jgi:hypothetical protein